MLGLETNFNKNLKDELQCIMSARAEEKGACVYFDDPADAQPTCKFVMRSECVVSSGNEEEVSSEESAGGLGDNFDGGAGDDEVGGENSEGGGFWSDVFGAGGAGEDHPPGGVCPYVPAAGSLSARLRLGSG